MLPVRFWCPGQVLTSSQNLGRSKMMSSLLVPRKYPSIITLPEDALFCVFLFADFGSLNSLLLTCKEVNNLISKRCELWSHLCRFYCRNFFAENGKHFLLPHSFLELEIIISSFCVFPYWQCLWMGNCVVRSCSSSWKTKEIHQNIWQSNHVVKFRINLMDI